MTARRKRKRRQRAVAAVRPAPVAVGYGITEDAHQLLCRAQQATLLLSTLSADVAFYAGFSESGPAAVADYVARDLETVLNGAVPLHPIDGGEPPFS